MHTDGPATPHERRTFVDLAGWRVVLVAGTDAVTWLHDLLTADIAGLARGQATRSLLLTPTGRIRADIWAYRREDDVLLLQDPAQPDHVAGLLDPYVLSSDVVMDDLTGTFTVIAVLAAAPPGIVGARTVTVRADGIRLVVSRSGPHAALAREALEAAGLVEADGSAMEAWRVRRGLPRMGWDFDRESLPSEAGLDDTIDATKGCFLGQESVAKIRNLGHPPRVLRHVQVLGSVRRGEVVLAGGARAGEVTSAVVDGDGSVCLARVRWAARAAPLSLRDGRPLTDLLHTD